MDTSALDPNNLDAFAKLALDAVQHSNWSLLASLGVLAGVALLRKLGVGKLHSWLDTDLGIASTTLVTAAAGAVATALLAGAPFTWPLVLTALKVGLGAAGGLKLLKLLAPKLAGLMGLTGAPSAKVQLAAQVAGAAASVSTAAKTVQDLVNGK